MNWTKRGKARRGVLLLVVLATLAMFGLFSIAFVVIASHAKRTSLAQAKIEQFHDPYESLLYQGLLQCLRGSNSRGSVLMPHGLLEDMYGNKVVTDTVKTVGATTGPLVSIEPNTPAQFTSPAGSFRQHVGCVLTTFGRGKPSSFRIVDCDPTAKTFLLLVDSPGSIQIGDSFVINGAAFSGTGFGYNSKFYLNSTETDPVLGAPLLTASINGSPANPGIQRYALLPNPTAFVQNAAFPDYTDPAGPGGANEDYDAPDYQDMLLAGRHLDPTTTPPTAAVVSPSLHRPELVNYWKNVPSANWDNDFDLQRRVILRPLQHDHPNFTGGNPTFDPINGPWDVDNDGDGLPDSIWVDLGLPARPGPNGKLYKPLFAILCEDLDGRLNLNAHGCLAQTLGNDNGINNYYGNTADATQLFKLTGNDGTSTPNYGGVSLGGNVFADSTPASTLRRGQGIGPAEINLAAALGGSSNLTIYGQLLRGANGMDGRYGEFGSALIAPGKSAAIDSLSVNMLSGFPDDYLATIGVGTLAAKPAARMSIYGSMADLKGSLAVGLDLRGQPLYSIIDDGSRPVAAGDPYLYSYARTNEAYETNLARNKNRGLPPQSPDNPFSAAELERIFRMNDRDATRLPPRLASLTSPNPGDPFQSILLTSTLRYEVTTEGWSVPSPGMAFPTQLATRLTASGGKWNGEAIERVSSPIDLLAARIALRSGSGMNQTTARSTAQSVAASLLPWEILAGRKMDVNRPLGNGMDDNNNGVVDEPNEPGDPYAYTYFDQTGAIKPLTSSPPSTVFRPASLPMAIADANGNGVVDSEDARLLYARQLYVTALMLIDNDYYPAWIPASDPLATKDEKRARWIAQWAVNVVDFYDRDSVMTRFPYDPNPFSGNAWTPDASHVVWGCERPELLITETLALHARRSEDLSNPGGKTTGSGSNKDADFDQHLRPLGSLFVEVFNPWSSAEGDSAEFTVDRAPWPPNLPGATGQWRGGVLLNQRNAANEPIWRMVIVDGASTSGPDDPTSPATVERSVYFAKPPAFTQTKDGNVCFYTEKGMPPIPHNRYAVIGPDGPVDPADPNTSKYKGRTYISPPTAPDPSHPELMKQIVLTPGVNGGKVDSNAADQVRVQNNDSARDDANIAEVKPPVAILVDKAVKGSDGSEVRQLRFSVSEPDGGYEDAANPLVWTPDHYGTGYGDWLYTTVDPHPADGPNPNATVKNPDLPANGMTKRFKRVYLQRLADPLSAYHATNNPYRSIDSMPIDLVVYNGWEATDDPLAGSDTDVVFRSRERGDKPASATEAGQVRNIWKAEPWDRPTEADNADSPDTESLHICQRVLKQTLGYLNKPFWPFAKASTLPQYAGDPEVSGAAKPFPWLNWNNRPFVSEMELMLVPWTSSSELLSNVSLAQNNVNPYTSDLNKVDVHNPSAAPPAEMAFPHLNNFFFDKANSNNASAHFYRLFDFLSVPSRFVGTRVFGDPTTLAATNGPFAPPFNQFSTYREPGRINLNTIPTQRVFQALLNRPDLGDDGIWASFNASRTTGYTISAIPLPTRITNPFRSYGGANLVPIPELRNAVVGSGKDEINATLLRPKSATESTPLFLSGASASAATEINNPQRNPYFRYQELQRLGNLVTTHSNAYAIWITVGYFEVTPGSSVSPDGYQLGAELGSDTGEVKRHRAFYMIDRSIPVGFQRGQDLNVDKTILLKRYIE